MLLFVCTGNTCRSPMAAALAETMGRKALSAGLYALPGAPATPQAVRAAARRGADLTGHRARMVTEEMMAAADRVLAMTEDHARALMDRFPRYAGKVSVLFPAIPDPYGGDDGVYEACARAIAEALKNLP